MDLELKQRFFITLFNEFHNEYRILILLLVVRIFSVVADFVTKGDATQQFQNEIKPVHMHCLDAYQQKTVEKVNWRRAFDK